MSENVSSDVLCPKHLNVNVTDNRSIDADIRCIDMYTHNTDQCFLKADFSAGYQSIFAVPLCRGIFLETLWNFGYHFHNFQTFHGIKDIFFIAFAEYRPFSGEKFANI